MDDRELLETEMRFGRNQAARADRAEAAIKRMRPVLESMADVMAFNSRDWGADKADAWMYGVFMGWGCEEQHDHDDICGGDGAMTEIAERFGWAPSAVARIHALRAAVRAIRDHTTGETP